MKDYLLLAFSNLRRRKLRSWLTIIGIFIGIAAIVAFISLGQGLENYINEQVSELGSDIILIMGKTGSVISPMASFMSNKPLTDNDVELVEKIRGVEIASSMIMYSVNIEYGEETKGILIYSMDPEDIDELFGQLSSFDVQFGRDLKPGDKYKAVIGERFHEYFEKDIRLGSKLEIEGYTFDIVGILKSIGNPQDDMSIYIPNNVMREILDEPEKVSIIYVKTGKGQVDKVAEDIEKEMRRDRNEKEGEESFDVSTSEQLLETFGDILAVVQAIVIGIAAISLVVGGIGIMNTMYTSVVERTKEIGTMKAVGAKNSDILKIFLFESGFLGLIGGVIGLAFGMAISKGVEYAIVNFYALQLLRITFDPVLIGSVLAFSFIVGSLSGLLPAIQASKLKPADALRYE